jgi:hypothetical protein
MYSRCLFIENVAPGFRVPYTIDTEIVLFEMASLNA